MLPSSAVAIDPALDALRLALSEPALATAEGGRTLFLRARADGALRAMIDGHWTCQQSLKPLADALGRAGLTVVQTLPQTRFERVLALPPRQREEARAVLAGALSVLAPGGLLIACMPNAEGARSGEADLRRLAGGHGHLSKHKCRVFWTRPAPHAIDQATLEAWLGLDAVQPVLDGRFLSRPGLFAWNRVDAASALLAAQLPATLSGHAADLGAGYGYLATQLLARCPGIAALDLYEAEARAIEPAERNLLAARGSRDVATAVHWHDVSAGLPRRYDVIVSNPPFHQHGRADVPELGRAFIRAAAAALRADGEFWMVANRHLPYESTLRTHFATLERVAEADGFKVLRARGVRS